MDVPEFTDELVDLIAGQSDAQSGQYSIRELERQRDDNLVGMMRILRKNNHGAGAVIAAHEAQLPMAQSAALPVTVDRVIPPSWVDYNGHMNEAHYAELGGQANDRFMEMIGADLDYVAAGYSYFTVENHIRYLDELHIGERVSVTTQLLSGEGKKLHLFHVIHKADGTLSATVESLMLHIDMSTRKTSLPQASVAENIAQWAARHAELPLPDGAGRAVGQR